MGSIPRTSGIYQILCIPTGKVYIGSAQILRYRWLQHRKALRGNCHWNAYLQHAWNKHGESNFEFQVIELVLSSFVLEREQYHIDHMHACDHAKGFNISPTAGSPLGVKRSAETRRKISVAQLGKKMGPMSAEHKAKIADSNRGKPHPKWTDDQRARLSGSRRRQPTQESIERMRSAKRGIAPSPQTIAAHVAKCSKTYIVTDPNGVDKTITNLRLFCRENDLNHGAMGSVSRGRVKHHKGWKCRALS